MALNRTLKNLHIRNCGITAYGIQRALLHLPQSRLKVLNCSYNDLTGIDGRCLAQLTGLSALYLQKTGLCDQELRSLRANLKGYRYLRYLDLQYNSFQTEIGVFRLAEIVRANTCLVSLRLSGSLNATPNVQYYDDDHVPNFIVSLMHNSQIKNVNLSMAWQDRLQRFNTDKNSRLRLHYNPDREATFGYC